MKKVEQSFTTNFIRWCKYNWRENSCLFEVKVARDGKSIPIREIKDHQIQTLKNAHKFIYKLSDIGMVTMPADVVCIINGTGYLVFNYLDKEFFIIHIDVYLRFISTATRKSITKDQARSIADRVGVLQ